MIKKYNFAYCINCEKEVKPKRKPMDNMYINVWVLILIFSLGLGFIPFLIYFLVILKKNLCPNCKSQVKFYVTREEIPDPKSQIIRILKTIENEKKEKEDSIQEELNLIFCPFCKKEISKQIEICPNCGSSLEE